LAAASSQEGDLSLDVAWIALCRPPAGKPVIKQQLGWALHPPEPMWLGQMALNGDQRKDDSDHSENY